MRQTSTEAAENKITMEEYLKRRQATTPPAMRGRTDSAEDTEHALKLAELLYV